MSNSCFYLPYLHCCGSYILIMEQNRTSKTSTLLFLLDRLNNIFLYRTGFKQHVAKLSVTVDLLLGNIPERTSFLVAGLKVALAPYLLLAQVGFSHTYTVTYRKTRFILFSFTFVSNISGVADSDLLAGPSFFNLF